MIAFRGVPRREIVKSIQAAQDFLLDLELGQKTDRLFYRIFGTQALSPLQLAENNDQLKQGIEPLNLMISGLANIFHYHAAADPRDQDRRSRAADIHKALNQWGAFRADQWFDFADEYDFEINRHLLRAYACHVDAKILKAEKPQLVEIFDIDRGHAENKSFRQKKAIDKFAKALRKLNPKTPAYVEEMAKLKSARQEMIRDATEPEWLYRMIPAIVNMTENGLHREMDAALNSRPQLIRRLTRTFYDLADIDHLTEQLPPSCLQFYNFPLPMKELEKFKETLSFDVDDEPDVKDLWTSLAVLQTKGEITRIVLATLENKEPFFNIYGTAAVIRMVAAKFPAQEIFNEYWEKITLPTLLLLPEPAPSP